MARLPDPYGVRPVASGVRPIASISNPGAVGNALAQAGRGLQSLASDMDAVFERRRREEAAAMAADAEVAASARLRDRLYNPESGFLSTSGANTVLGRDRVLKDLDGVLDESLKGLRPDVAERLRPVLLDRIETAKRQVDIHTSTQRTAWLNSASEARVANAQADAVTRFGSQDEVEKNITIATGELRNRAEREGWPPEALELAVESTTAKTLRGVVVRMADAGHPNAAMEFARKNADRLGPEMAYIEQTVLPEAKKAEGRAIADQAMAGSGALAPPSLFNTESGGKFGARNDALGSSGRRGHFGRAQFGLDRLDDVKRAGIIPADMTPEQFLDDKDAQIRAEQWHFADIQKRIDGDGLGAYIGKTVGGVEITRDGIVAMAHLGGLNGAKKFLETDGAYNPADENGTRLSDYASTHAGNTTAPAGKGAADPLAIAMAIEDPDIREAALARIDQVRRVEAAQETARRRDAQEQIWQAVEAGTDPATLPLDVRKNAGPEAVRALESYYNQKSSGFAVRTDPELFIELMTEAGKDPTALLGRDLLAYRDRLSEQDFRTFTQMRSQVEAGGNVQGVSFDYASRIWRSAGIEDGAAGSELGKLYAGLQVEFTREWLGFAEREKRQPGLAEQADIARRVATASGLGGTAQRLSRDQLATVSVSELRTSAEPALRAAGLWQPSGETDAQTAAEFHLAHQEAAQRFVTRNGRQPTSIEAAQMADQMLRKFDVDPAGLLNAETKRAYEVTMQDLEGVRLGDTTLRYNNRDITLAEIQMAGRMLAQMGNTDPSVSDLLALISNE